MEAGRELDALVAEMVTHEPPRLSWELLSPDGTASAFTGQSPAEVESFQRSILEQIHKSWLKDYHVGSCKHYPRYSTDIAAAWMVVEKMEESGFGITLHEVIPDSDACVFLCNFGLNPDDESCELTAPMAICLAALKAVGVPIPAGRA